MNWTRFLAAAASLSVLCSSSVPSSVFTFGPVARNFVSTASASALPLYLAAVFLNEGPFLSLSTEWHLVQPLSFRALLAASASTAALAGRTNAKAAAAAARSAIVFMEFLSCAERFWNQLSSTGSSQLNNGRAYRRVDQPQQRPLGCRCYCGPAICIH